MVYALLTFIAIVASNIFTKEHGPIEVYGYTFTLGAILITPVWVMRDTLHEDGKAWYIFLSIVFGVIGLFLTVGTYLANITAIALVWSFLVDTNLYIICRLYWNEWRARIISDVITLPLATAAFFYIRDGVFEWPDGQNIVKYLTLLLCYGIILAHRGLRSKSQRYHNFCI